MTETTESRTREKIQVRADFYVIALTMPAPLWLAKMDDKPCEAFFKADRYSVWNGRLQVELDAEDGHQYKTAKGAKAAIDRLLARSIIRPNHEPRVVRYTKTMTQRWDVIDV